MADDDADVPIRVDFRDASTARAWVEETGIKKPFRPRFFAAFCAALLPRPQLRILELGSGPGQLARETGNRGPPRLATRSRGRPLLAPAPSIASCHEVRWTSVRPTIW